MRRFFVEKIGKNEGFCSITGPEARHISKVLRMGPGDRFVLMDGKGARFQALIESVGSREISVLLEKTLLTPPPSPVKITLCQAITKSHAMDYLIQKTSELGVDCIIPFFSQRTVVKMEKGRIENKMRHWRKIAHSSAKQSDRGLPAEIRPVVDFRQVMEIHEGSDALKVFLWEEEGTRNLKDVLGSCSSVKQFVGVVGPEGGFTQEEVEAGKDAGFISVSLGNRILRSETAAITMVAIVQYEFGDLGLKRE